MKELKFVTTLVLEFKELKICDETKYSIFYLFSQGETIINDSDIGNLFESVYSKIISNIQQLLGKGSDWIIDSIVDHAINISKYMPLWGSSSIRPSKNWCD